MEWLENFNVEEELISIFAPTQAGIYNSILRNYWQILEQHPKLKNALKAILQSDKGVQLEPNFTYKLESMGLVKLEGNCLKISCDLYRQYFRVYLI